MASLELVATVGGDPLESASSASWMQRPHWTNDSRLLNLILGRLGVSRRDPWSPRSK